MRFPYLFHVHNVFKHEAIVEYYETQNSCQVGSFVPYPFLGYTYKGQDRDNSFPNIAMYLL